MEDLEVDSDPKEKIEYLNDVQQVSRVLSLIYKLCKTLADENITYCHWKSNAALDRSASGDNDLDLLVGRADIQHFTEILFRLGFKESRFGQAKELPGVLNYYGLDEDTGRLVHVHAHYQLIMGDDATKNYCLPIEEAFLSSAVQGELFKVPSFEHELIVFVIRMMLKHSAWDAILSFHGSLSISEQQELSYLIKRVDQVRMHDILNRDLPFLDGVLFDQCLQSLQSNYPIRLRYKTGRRLHRELQAYARRSFISDTYLKIWRRGLWGVRRYIFRRPARKYLANGGAIIALVGGDGSGKSTSVTELYDWLSKNFTTTKIHLGKPRWGLMTLPVKAILKVGRWLGIFSNQQYPVHSLVNEQSLERPGYPWLLWHVFTARDRYLAYVRARRFSTNGGLVICDRFPLKQVKSMDGVRTAHLFNAEETEPLISFLIKLEEKFYQSIMPPNLLIVMKIDPEIAVQRRADEDMNWIRNRNQEIWEFDWENTPFHVIDSGQPKEEMLLKLKSLVWSKL